MDGRILEQVLRFGHLETGAGREDQVGHSRRLSGAGFGSDPEPQQGEQPQAVHRRAGRGHGSGGDPSVLAPQFVGEFEDGEPFPGQFLEDLVQQALRLEHQPLVARLRRIERGPAFHRRVGPKDSGGPDFDFPGSEAVQAVSRFAVPVAESPAGEAQQVLEAADSEFFQVGEQGVGESEPHQRRPAGGPFLLGGSSEDLFAEQRPSRRESAETGETDRRRRAEADLFQVAPQGSDPIGRGAEHRGEPGGPKPEGADGAEPGERGADLRRGLDLRTPAVEALGQPGDRSPDLGICDPVDPEVGAAGGGRRRTHPRTDSLPRRFAVHPDDRLPGFAAGNDRRRRVPPIGMAPEQQLQRQRRHINTCQTCLRGHRIPPKTGNREGKGSARAGLRRISCP